MSPVEANLLCAFNDWKVRAQSDAVRAALLFGFALWRVLARRARARTPAVVRKCAPGRRMLWRLGRGIAEC